MVKAPFILAQLFFPTATSIGSGFGSAFGSAFGIEDVLSISAQSTTDRVLDLATEIAILAATLFVVAILILGIWSTITSPKTSLGRLLNSFRIDHLYLDIGLNLNPSTPTEPRKSFLRSLSLRHASLVTSQPLLPGQSALAFAVPLPGQPAELSLPGMPGLLKGRVIKAAPVNGLEGSYNLDVAFDVLPAEVRASLANFIRGLRHTTRS